MRINWFQTDSSDSISHSKVLQLNEQAISAYRSAYLISRTEDIVVCSSIVDDICYLIPIFLRSLLVLIASLHHLDIQAIRRRTIGK